MGYRVITEAGAGTRDFEYDDADTYYVDNGNYLKVGTDGTNKVGSIEGEKFASFNYDKVIAIEKI